MNRQLGQRRKRKRRLKQPRRKQLTSGDGKGKTRQVGHAVLQTQQRHLDTVRLIQRWTFEKRYRVYTLQCSQSSKKRVKSVSINIKEISLDHLKVIISHPG